MSDSGEQKIKISAGLTPRVVTAIQAEAKRLGVSFGDMLRRITDQWLDTRESAKAPANRSVLVLDRERNEIREAR